MTKNQIDYYAAVEQSRHNRATEQETIRSNKAKEANQAREIEENAAHMRRSDLINQEHFIRMDLESKRHSEAQESISRYSNAMTEAHYIRSDANTATSNLISSAKVNEDIRHNKVVESLTDVLNRSQIALNSSTATLNSAKAIEATEHANTYLYDQELTNQKRLTEVMNTELTKQQVLTNKAQREKLVTETVAIPWNTAGNVIGGIGRFIGGLHGISLGGTPTSMGRYESSATYNSALGVYE